MSPIAPNRATHSAVPRSPEPSVALLLVAALLGFVTPGAVGQGTPGVLPDPITVRQVDAWAGQLGFGNASDDARPMQLDAAHESYRAEFARLRDGEIERHLKEHPRRLGQAAADPRSARATMRSQRAILDRIAQLDATLLATLAELAPDAAEQVERFELAERRRRARGVFGTLSLMGADLELGSDVDGLELDAQQRAAAQPALLAYERTITRLLEELADAVVRHPVVYAEALERSGLADPGWIVDDSDELAAAIRDLRREATAAQRRLRAELAKTHREFADAMAAAIGADTARAVRMALIRRGYRGVLGLSLESGFDRAIRRAGDDATIAEIQGLRGEYRAQRDPVENQLMDIADAQRRDAVGLAMVIDIGGNDDWQRARRAAADRRDAIDGEFRGLLASLAGADDAADPAVRLMPGGGAIQIGERDIVLPEGMTVMVGDGPGGGGVVMASMGVAASPGGRFGLPSSLPRELLEPLEESTPHLWAIVEVLHREYALRYAEAEETERAALRELGGAGDPFAGPTDPATIDRRHAQARQAVERLLSIDALLMADLEAALADSPAAQMLARIRGVRERAALAAASGGGSMISFSPSREADVDLVTVLSQVRLEPETQSAIEPTIRRWEESATGLHRQRYETTATQRRENDRFMAKMATVSEGRVEVSISSDDDGFADFERGQRLMADARDAVSNFNRRTRDEVAALLTEAEARAFRRAYGRAAFPGVYRDPQDITPKLDRALALEDLTEEQLAAIVEIVVSHHAEYDEHCDRLVAIESEAPAFRPGAGPPDMDAIRAMEARQGAVGRLRFERAEVGAATLRKLAAILDADQIQRLGGLEPPAPAAPTVIEFSR